VVVWTKKSSFLGSRRDVFRRPSAASEPIALSVCLSVRLSFTFVYSVETSKQYPFLPLSSHTILFCLYQSRGNIPTSSHYTNKNRDFRPISGFAIDHCWIVSTLQMAPFDRSHTSSYSPSIVTMAIFCIVCEIDVLVENREFLYRTCI